MKILLVYPRYPETFWSFKHVLHFVSKKAAFPPLGLLTIASMLPKKWELKLVDTNIQHLYKKDIEWADMVFISAMLIQKESVEKIVNMCKEKTVVAGGPLFTSQKIKGIDHYILNEAEITLPRFLKDLENGKLKKRYSSSKKPDITKTPIPKWSLINFKDYNTMPVQYSRGCPFNCEFCDIVIMNGRVPRLKTPYQIISEISSLYKAGWRGSIFIVDDNFIGNKKEVKNMLRYLIKWQKKHKYPFELLTETSTDLASDEELMRLLSLANFNKVFVGIETPDMDSLKECSKYQNTNIDLVKSIKKIQSHGMQVMGGFIVGFDNDNEHIFERQIKFIQQVGIVTAMVGILNAIPQTRLWHRLRDEERLLCESSGENKNQINFIPKMGKQNLIDGYKKIIRNIYSPKNYYKRIHTFLKSYNPTSRSKIRFEDVKVFIKSIFKIGIFSKSRFRYWKLLIKTFLTKRKAFAVAVELAIYSIHFEKVSKTVLRD